MDFTGLLSRALSFFSRVLSALTRSLLFVCRALFFPLLARFTSGNVSGATPHSSKQVQIPDPEESDELHLAKYSSGPAVEEKTECVLITHICAIDVAIKLRRIPVGFYVAVKTGNVTKRTLIKPASVNKNVMEWDDEILLPSDPSSRVSFMIYASFELGPTLGDGEALGKFEGTVVELLDRYEQFEPIRFVEQRDGEVNSSRPSFKVRIEKRVCGRNQYVAASDPPESEEMCRLGELTDKGHHALIRYRDLQERRDLEQSIRSFEQARDVCPMDHPSRATVLFNLANAKLIYCRLNDVSPDLDLPISLYRDVLRLRPRGHPDHPFTSLSLGIALQARFQRQSDEESKVEGESHLSQVLAVAPSDSYIYHAAVLALGSTARPELTRLPSMCQTTEDDGDDDDDNEEIQRLDAALQWIFHPDSYEHGLLDHLGTLFCIRLDRLGDLGDPEKTISMLGVVVQFTSDDHPDKSSWLDDLGDSFLTLYTRCGDREDLEKSISVFEDALKFTPDDHPDKLLRLDNLGHSLYTRYKRFGDVVDLERSILLREDALRFTPDENLDKPVWLSKLGQLLSARYERFGDVADLARSISLLEDAVQIAPDDDPIKPARLITLGKSLSIRYERFGRIEDLGRSISLFEDALQFTPHDHPKKPVRLNNLGHSLLTRYQRFGDVTDLERSISLYEDALQFTPEGHLDRPLRLNSLAGSLSNRYERFGDSADLEKSVSLFEDAAQSTPDGHPDKHTRLYNFGDSLMTRYQRFGDDVDLRKAILTLEEALRVTPDDHLDKPLLLSTLGTSLSIRCERFGDVADLEQSILLKDNALELTPEGHPDKPARLNNLGISLLTRYERFGDIVDLERSISLFKETVQSTPDGNPDKPLRLSNLGCSLSTRYRCLGDITDLERSISLFEDAVQSTPDENPDKPLRINNFSHSLLARYWSIGDGVDLERSILLTEHALKLTPEGHPNRPLRLDDLGISIWARHERYGDNADLESSISLLEDAAQFTPDDHPDKPLRLSNLSLALSTRYQYFGDADDLERCILLREVALQLTPGGHLEKPVLLDGLGRALSTRYERFNNSVDLERSISLSEDALRFTTDGHPGKPIRLNNLAYLLSTRYERLGDVISLERSITLLEDAVQSTPDGHPERPGILDNLGHSLFTRYQRSEGVVDLERSISMFGDAVQFTPDGHPDKSSRLNNLAVSLLERFQCHSDPSSVDLSQAILHSEHAARSHTGPALYRFIASGVWIRCIRSLPHNSQSLLDAYTLGVSLLPQLAWMGLSLHDRYHQLLRAADGACDAVAAALDVHRPELAVEWLEQGRSIMWSQLSQLRTPVDDLRNAHPELAAQFERVSHELEHASARDSFAVKELTKHSKMVDGLLERQAGQHHALALSRERLLTEIRALPGFERFLLPKTIKQLSPLVYLGPVVFLNASRHRCDALIVMAGSGHVVHVPLSNTNYDEVVGMQRRLNDLLRLKGRVVLRDSERGARPKGLTPDDAFKSILPCLWEKVVSPILAALAFSPSGADNLNLPRIFWCPTGPFSFLPIHAAGIYGTTNSGPKLSDFAISSYIPTMSALELPPLEDSGTTSRNIRLLAVPQPSTDGQSHLSGVQGEIECIRKLASLSPFVGFQEANGTIEDVLSKMAETNWVHFACHGTQDRINPFDSGLLLAHGKRLKLSDIARMSRPNGGLAFLSACHTATGDEQLSEEAIHIAAGMLLAGYRGVIATMWSIMDNDAPRVTEDVYENLFSSDKAPDTRRAAAALHDAIERLRDSGASFLSWVPFIHVGL